MSECTCAEWGPNIKLINGPGMLAQARNPQYGNPYAGLMPLRYCPWCGRGLLTDEQAAFLKQQDQTKPEAAP